MTRFSASVLAVALAAGCADETAVYVVVDAQDLGRARGATLTVRAFGADGELDPPIAPFDLEENPLPIVIRMLPNGGDAERRWALSARLDRADGEEVNENRVVGGFVPGEARYALLCLQDACRDVRTELDPSGCDPSDPDAACEGCEEELVQVIEVGLVEDGDDLRCPPVVVPELFCADGVDDDGDGDIDCDDEDCEGRPCSAAGEACDGVVCRCIAAPSEVDCSNGLDDDCDGAIDCADPECAEAACDDGMPCTRADACIEGECVGFDNACDDGVPCTADTCDPSGACDNEPAHAACDDGVACTLDLCDPVAGCTSTPDSTACPSDGIDCTRETCEPAMGGCITVPDASLCPDLGGMCRATVCDPDGGCVLSDDASGCDDGDDCTDDVCDASGRCVHTNNTAPCDDGVACTSNDRCDGAGSCHGTSTCADLTGCTTDVCNLATGSCEFHPNTASCDDEQVCTATDRCSGGRCVGSGNACTGPDYNDACRAGGCLFGNCYGWPVADGTSCGTNLRCCGGGCVSMGGGANCGGCGHQCTSGSCRQVPGVSGNVRYHCDCSGGTSCPQNQRCRRPPNESDDRCVCQNDSQCSGSTTCRIRSDRYNFCLF